MRARQGGWLWLGYLLFIVYGSLVPLEPRALTLDSALSMFANIRLLDVGAQGRADWVANGVLYFPLGFLSANLLTHRNTDRPTVFAWLVAILFGIALAVSVEFLQLYFPPRTVSLNDLLAETIGTALGASFAFVGLTRFRSLFAAVFGDHERLNAVLLKAYLVLYFLLALFPFDFVVSWRELSAKFATGQLAVLLAPAAADSSLRVLVKLIAEVLAAAPIGLFLASRRRLAPQGGLTRGFIAGAAIGLLIEFAQLLLVSGVSQGLSVLTRGVGAALGLAAAQKLRGSDLQGFVHGFRRFGGLIATAYVLALLAVNDWFTRGWLGPAHALDVFERLRFLPFYYHYYTTEQVALLSLIAVFAMYAPTGMLCWVSGFRASGAAVASALLCFVVEGSKLFLAGLHPDPTNVLLAALAGWFGWGLCKRLVTNRGHSNDAARVAGASPAANGPTRPVEIGNAVGKRPGRRREGHERSRAHKSHTTASPGLLSVAAVLLLWFAVRFPFHGVLLAAGLAGYVVLIWKRPAWSLFCIPLGLVTLDLAPWSGWYFLDEFDVLMALSISVVLARVPGSGSRMHAGDGLMRAVTALVIASYVIGAMRGLFPLPPLDVGSATLPYSPLNALRLAKGVLWALAMFLLVRRLRRAGYDSVRLFTRGVLAGLVTVVLVVIWERAAFPGILALADVYRVTGPFSQMHVGGADLETWLVAAAPMLVIEILSARSRSARVVGVVLLVASSYCLIVTFSRAAYIGYGLGLLVAAAIFVWYTRQSSSTKGKQTWLATASMLGLVGVMLVAGIVVSPFAKERLARSGNDVSVRMQHWQDALGMRDPDWATTVLGMGLGSFPATHYWRSNEKHAAAFGLGQDDGNRFLRLGPGSPVYIDQFVDIANEHAPRIDLRLRSSEGDAKVTVSLCEKWLLTSGRCASVEFAAGGDGEWHHVSAELPPGELADQRDFLRPIKFSLHYSGGTSVLDLDDVRMQDSTGQNELANGDFSHGLDRWFFSVDNDLPWHAWSLPVGVLFEQGWFGLVAFAGLLAGAAWRALQAASTHPARSAWMLGSLLGLVVLSSVNTIVDSPRMLFLVLTIALLASGQRRGARRRDDADRSSDHTAGPSGRVSRELRASPTGPEERLRTPAGGQQAP